MRRLAVGAACALAAVVLVQPVVAAEERVPDVYIHLGGQVGLDWLSSSDIDSAVGNFSVGSLDAPVGLLGRVGFRNVVQVEVQRLKTHHDLRQVGIAQGSGFLNTGLRTVAEINMKYEEAAQVIKLNPVFWSYSRRKASALLLIFGTGEVTYRDDRGDGWEGTSNIYGIEWTKIQRYISVAAGLRYSKINFDSNTLAALRNRNFAADQYYLYVNLAFGLGY